MTIVVTGFGAGIAAGYGLRLHQGRSLGRRWTTQAEVVLERSRRTLSDCCRLGTHAMLVDVASGNTSPARFVSVQRDAVHFETTGEGGDQECWSKRALVAVQFNLEGKARMFVAPLMDATPATSGATCLATAMPRHIADSEARAAFRVDIPRSERIEATLHCEAGALEATVADASTTGMGLSCAEAGRLSRGDVVEVQVAIGGQEIRRPGVVRRIQGRSVGIAFPVVVGGEVPPEQEAYFDLIRSLLDREDP